MKAFLHRYATPATTGLFLISLITGVALFFHIGPSGFRGAHEWLSLVLALPFGLHLWRNWRAFAAYFRHAPMVWALAVSAVLTAAFVLPGLGDTETRDLPPPMRLANQVLAAPVETVAPVIGTTPEALVARLGQAGIPVVPGQPLQAAAVAAGKTDRDLTAALVSPSAGS